MPDRARDLIASLSLSAHREGGYFRETYRSIAHVHPDDDRDERSALTTIYFLLAEGDVSRWHRVRSDEVWHYCEGDVLEIQTADAEFTRISTHLVGPLDRGAQPVSVVTAGTWQAARSTGAYTLVGCTVGPGFDFADFVLLRDRPRDAETAARRHPAITPLL